MQRLEHNTTFGRREREVIEPPTTVQLHFAVEALNQSGLNGRRSSTMHDPSLIGEDIARLVQAGRPWPGDRSWNLPLRYVQVPSRFSYYRILP